MIQVVESYAQGVEWLCWALIAGWFLERVERGPFWMPGAMAEACYTALVKVGAIDLGRTVN